MADVSTVAELFADKYKVVEKLEWNGLALVYKAVRENGEALAVAMLPVDAEGSEEATAAFKSKAAELQLLVEPGIVRVSGHGIQHGVPYLELEYLDATTLAEELLDGPLERDQAIALTSELLDILGRAHAGGHFHWDLTPSNILLAPGMDGSEHASVIGFGIQQIIRASFDPEKTGPTGRGSGRKAKRYLAPELQDARDPDARADVYGVAAVLHHMLTGSPPGPGSTPPPDDLAEALAQAMAEDRSARPADAATFGFTLAGGAAAGGGDKPSFAPPASSMPAAPFGAPDPIEEPVVPEAAAVPAPEADVPPAPEPELPSFLDHTDLPTDATVVDAPILQENEITGRIDEPLPSAAMPPPPAPEPPAPSLPSVLDPPSPDADYESLGPPSSGAAVDAATDLNALLEEAAVAPPGPPAPPAAVAPPAPLAAPAPTPATPSSPADPFSAKPAARTAADPFAPAARAPEGAVTKNPYEAEEFAEQEKKRGSMLAAIVVLTIAIGLVTAFFMIRSAG